MPTIEERVARIEVAVFGGRPVDTQPPARSRGVVVAEEQIKPKYDLNIDIGTASLGAIVTLANGDSRRDRGMGSLREWLAALIDAERKDAGEKMRERCATRAFAFYSKHTGAREIEQAIRALKVDA